MTIDKQALRERYSPQPIPKCHICGAEMTVQRMSASRITYGCTGATYDDNGCHYVEGRSIADDHYEQSRITVVDVSDPDVLTLLDELEEKDASLKSSGKRESAARRRIDELLAENEAVEKRIADYHSVLNNLSAVARRYLPDYDEHPDIQAADDLLESAAGIGKGNKYVE